jgi:ribosomal-protein-serine acetyltransferase
MEKFKFKEILDGKRIYLKKHDVELAEIMFQYVDKDRERLGKFLPWVGFTKTVEDEIDYIKHTHNCWDEGTLFDYGIYLKEKDKYIGNCGVHSIRWGHNACELGYWILGEFEGQGYMSESVRTLEAYLFTEGFNRVQIRCSDINNRSESIPKNNGYIFEGTARQDSIEKGKYRNTKTFSKLSSEFLSKES